MSNYDSGSLASLKLKFQVVFTLLVVIGALLIPWFILAESSPLASPNSDLPLIWSPTVMVPFLISAVITGNPPLLFLGADDLDIDHSMVHLGISPSHSLGARVGAFNQEVTTVAKLSTIQSYTMLDSAFSKEN